MKKLFIVTTMFAIFSILPNISNAQESEINIREKSAERAGKIFDAIDINSDGVVSKDEFVDFHSRLVERRMDKFMPDEKPVSVEIQIEEDDEETVSAPASSPAYSGDIPSAEPTDAYDVEEDISETEVTEEMQEPSF